MFNNTRYMTQGIQEEVGLGLQIILWQLIDDCKAKGLKLDYLQVFELSTEVVGVHPFRSSSTGRRNLSTGERIDLLPLKSLRKQQSGQSMMVTIPPCSFRANIREGGDEMKPWIIILLYVLQLILEGLTKEAAVQKAASHFGVLAKDIRRKL
jgi:hypothetical protein